MRFVCVLGVCLLPALAAAQPIGQVELLHAFRAAPANPVGGLARAADGSFYGLTARLLYRLAADGTLTVVHTFEPSSSGSGAPTVGAGGVVYGTVLKGSRVAVFRFEPATSTYRILHTFDAARDGHMVPDEYGRTRHRLVFGPDVMLYGTTSGDHPSISPARYGTVYRVDPVSGAGTTLHEFSGAAPALRNPMGGLVDAGGQLYGVARYGGTPGAVPAEDGQGGIFRLDPATGTITTVHLLSGTTGRNPMVGLTRTSDGWIYGTAFRNVPGGSTTATHVFRFTPPSGTLEIVAASGNDPSQLVEAGDGHLYGVSEHNPTVFRVRRAGGVHTVETVHEHAVGEGNIGLREALGVGLDGFLYGTASIEGPHRVGSAFRFDPLAGGGSGNPSQFATVHPFFQNSHTWLPSVPVRAPNGHLYGTTSRGGATLRGAVYKIDGVTGAVTILGPMPGTSPNPSVASAIENSDFVVGLDGLLYGTSTVDDFRIVRVDPTSGAITTAAMAGSRPFGGLTRGADGGLYLTSIAFNDNNAISVSRFDPVTNTLPEVARRRTERGALGGSRPVLAADNQLYLTIDYFEPLGGPFPSTVELARVDVAGGAFATVAGPASFPQQPQTLTNVKSRKATPIAGANGTILVPVRVPTGAISLFEVTPPTGAVRMVCADFGELATRGPDAAAPYAIEGRLRRCDVATGATLGQTLPDAVGTAQRPLTVVGGVLHGAAAGGLYGGGTVFRIHLDTVPPTDSDGDGLINTWETAYGLDPFSASGLDGASGDPDDDGRTNAQELADGTHPRGTFTRYFAEGATGPFFRTRIDLANPTAGPADVLLRFQTDTGARIGYPVLVPPGGHVAIDPASIAGLGHASFSTIVEADGTVGAERTMAWDPSGYGSHIETGVVAPATTWYLAEGSTSGPFALFYLLQNPQSTAVTATVRYLRPFGLPPIDRTYTLPPSSRTTIVVDDQGPELTSTDLSAVITAPSPIVAERAMYYSSLGQVFAAGHESAGVTAPALEWFLAEGATGAFFDLFVLIANPNASAASVDVEYLLIGGGTLTKTYSVPGNSRLTIWVDDEQLPAGSGTRPLANAALSMVVRSTNAVPIVVERTMWWPGPSLTPSFWYETHNSPGATTTSTRWLVAGGELGGASGAQTYVLVANPSTTTGRARVSVLEATGSRFLRDIDLPAKSRTNVEIPAGFAATFGVLVESLGADPVGIVVERATYSSPGGVTWAAGGNALAAPLP